MAAGWLLLACIGYAVVVRGDATPDRFAKPEYWAQYAVVQGSMGADSVTVDFNGRTIQLAPEVQDMLLYQDTQHQAELEEVTQGYRDQIQALQDTLEALRDDLDGYGSDCSAQDARLDSLEGQFNRLRQGLEAAVQALQ